jgi:hypothetical protein
MKNSKIEQPLGDSDSLATLLTSSCRHSSITFKVWQWSTIARIRLLVLLSVILVSAGETSDSFAADAAVIDVTQFGIAKGDILNVPFFFRSSISRLMAPRTG